MHGAALKGNRPLPALFARVALPALLTLAGCVPTPDAAAPAAPQTPVAQVASAALAASTTQPMLLALPQLTQHFKAPQGPSRSDSALTDLPANPDPAARAQLASALRALQPADGAPEVLHSVYVYRQGPGLDPSTQLSAQELRSAHANALVAYARWSNGRLDMLLLIDKLQVVYDLLLDQPVDPPWEFR
jgi:hypothetical protein